MPKYLNPNSAPYMNRGVVIPPFQSLETIKILETPPLVKTSDEPFFNPVYNIDDISFDREETQEVEIDLDNTYKIKLYNSNGSFGFIDVYLNNVNNIPKWARLDPGQSEEIFLDYKVDKIIMVSTDNASVRVTHFTRTS